MLLHTLRTVYFLVNGAFFSASLPSLFSPCLTRVYVGFRTMDLVLESGLKAWDIDAAIPVVAGAGGLTTDWRGQPVGAFGGQIAIAGDRALLDAALPLLAPAAA